MKSVRILPLFGLGSLLFGVVSTDCPRRRVGARTGAIRRIDQIIVINTIWSDSPVVMRSFEEHHHINHPAALDAGKLTTARYRVFKIPTEFIVDVNGVIRYRDGVPKYLVAHLPAWLLPYVPSKRTAALACTK